jgi:SPP1 family phage portal protein
MAKKNTEVVVVGDEEAAVDETPLVELVLAIGRTVTGISEALDQYDTQEHDVFKIAKRPKKPVQKPSGLKDALGKDIINTTLEEVNRIALPLQKLIVTRRAAFMNVAKMELDCKPANNLEQTLLDMIKKCRDDNKVQFKAKEIAKRMMSELQCAALWYSENVNASYWGSLAPSATKRMRMEVLSPRKGDKLYPVFNGLGNLTYFGRQYETLKDITGLEITKEIVAAASEKVIHFDVYSDTFIYLFEQVSGGWLMKKKIKHSYGKIPVIYYEQDRPEWADVQSEINRLETVLSNFADTNDYNGSPILVSKGVIKGFSAKGERGKVLELDGKDSDIKYVTWEQAPVSIKLEIDSLVDFIFTCSQTPNITVKEMSGIGAAPSGAAFDRVLMDPHLAAQDKLDGMYGEGAQRELSFLKSACIAINKTLQPASQMAISPKFTLFRIDDRREAIDDSIAALNGGIASLETAVAMAGLTDDNTAEIRLIQKAADTLGDDIEDDQ